MHDGFLNAFQVFHPLYAGIRKSSFFFDWESVDVCTKQDDRSGAVVEYGGDACFPNAVLDVEDSPLLKLLMDSPRRLMLLK